MQVVSGGPNVNIDLIAGIEREVFDNTERTMDAVAALGTLPDQLTLFTPSVREGSINRCARPRMPALGYWQYQRNLFPCENWIFHYQDFTYLNAFPYRDYLRRIEEDERRIRQAGEFADVSDLFVRLVCSPAANDDIRGGGQGELALAGTGRRPNSFGFTV